MVLPSALLTDQYELIMAQGYWRLEMAEQEAVFYLGYRSNPFDGNYVIACGLAEVIKYLSHYAFSESDIAYLQSCRAPEDEPLFEPRFLQYLSELKFTCDIDAVPEGTLVQPKEPLLRIQGPLIQCQILETALMNFMNFASLIATKASRIYLVAEGDSLMEFGLRRAQGPDGGLTASRAAYIGGCNSTSNVLAGKTYGIPIQGTQAHSWILAFPSELEAFRAFAKTMKSQTVLLVDTYDTVSGVKNAIIVGNELRKEGHDLAAIRLDSGDIGALSTTARKMLDEAGFDKTRIVVSGDLDEYRIKELKRQGAPINAWGVGTRLVTSHDQPALNTIYKLAAIKNASNQWDYKLKVSDHVKKTTMAGIHQVRRYLTNEIFIGDCVYDVVFGINNDFLPGSDQYEDLLVPIFRKGKLVYEQPSILAMQSRTKTQLRQFLNNAESYPVTLEPQLLKLQQDLGAKLE
ncbi:MAG: nicotinate phosphoribosyltransferase [Gammaproteobacteria bacterium]|nr:nicotinate phosphoribosyltransferase [Gammaproteobacteria bacterium]